jgi:hypothetical protein
LTREGGKNTCLSSQHKPEQLTATAGGLAAISSQMNAQHAAAARRQKWFPTATDEVSALTAEQFAAHAQMYQAVSAQAAAMREMFVDTLATSSGSYAATAATLAVTAS